MNRFARSKYLSNYPFRGGYTLVEILVATTLSLIILGAVVHLFGTVGTTITQSRSIMESAERLRATQNRLQMDLEGLTVTPIPPRRPDNSEGYIEIVKGLMMQGTHGTYSSMNNSTNPPTPIAPIPMPVDSDKSNNLDSTVGPVADILMFTTRTKGKPFTGKFLGASVESDVAEVAWFVRGNTLYRRQLLVAPQLFVAQSGLGFFKDNDISVHVGAGGTVIPNTLSDLTRRECRYAHPSAAPYDIRSWSYLGLPTAKETSDPDFIACAWDASRIASGSPTPNVMDDFYAKHSSDWKNMIAGNPYPKFDLWTTNPTARLSDSELIKKTTTTPPETYKGPAVADDVILTNVIGFDVKVWDAGYPILQDNTGQVLKPGDPQYILPGHPHYAATLPYTVLGFGGYVDLGYYDIYDYTSWGSKTLPCPAPQPNYSSYGNRYSVLCGSPLIPRVYDTWCNTYDLAKTASGYHPARNGFDDNGSGIVDGDSELIFDTTKFGQDFVTPYPAPLRGIQVIIRIFEPDSRQIREVTIQQDFLPK